MCCILLKQPGQSHNQKQDACRNAAVERECLSSPFSKAGAGAKRKDRKEERKETKEEKRRRAKAGANSGCAAVERKSGSKKNGLLWRKRMGAVNVRSCMIRTDMQNKTDTAQGKGHFF